MLPLLPGSQNQMRALGSVIKENIPGEKLSAAFWKFLLKRAPFAHPPQPLSLFLPVMLFFPPSSLLAAVWHKKNIKESAWSLPDTPQHTAIQEAGEHDAEEKKPAKKQKAKNEKSAEHIHKMK